MFSDKQILKEDLERKAKEGIKPRECPRNHYGWYAVYPWCAVIRMEGKKDGKRRSSQAP